MRKRATGPSAAVVDDLIFDLGMHNALDTRFYLDKGFRVVALEANPELVRLAQESLKDACGNGRLCIESKALWHISKSEISFFINPVKDDWSSAFREWAEKGGHEAREIAVQTVTLSDLFDQYGVPRYIKCDIEGADELFARQLLADARRPLFVSVEACSLEVLALLVSAGYDRVQIVNQGFSSYVKAPQPPREGSYVEATFTGHMSGLFGGDLDPSKWTSFTHAAESYLAFVRLHQRDPLLAHGWLDFHVTTQAALDNAS